MSGKQRFDISIHQINRRHSTTRLTMNYAKALTSSLVDKSAIDIVREQAQLELKRKLTQVEENLLKTKYSVNLLSSQIPKVCNQTY